MFPPARSVTPYSSTKPRKRSFDSPAKGRPSGTISGIARPGEPVGPQASEYSREVNTPMKICRPHERRICGSIGSFERGKVHFAVSALRGLLSSIEKS